MHRLIRTQLAFLNSSESTRFLSLVAPSLRRFSHLRSLAAVSLIPKPPSTQSLRHSRPPLCADAMDSHPLSASGIEDFVHVDGAGAGAGAVSDSNFRSEGSEESVVADTAVEEATGGEVESQGYARKVLPEELSKSVVMLNCDSSAEGGACDVYLLGTAHVSSVNPDFAFIVYGYFLLKIGRMNVVSIVCGTWKLFLEFLFVKIMFRL